MAALTVVALAPNPASSLWTAQVPRPAFFGGGASTTALDPGTTAIVLPYGASGWSLLWQAEDSFRFRLVGGHIGRRTTVAEASWDDVYRTLASGRGSDRRRVQAFLREHDVDVIVVTPDTPPRVAHLVASLGLPVERRTDALVYRVRAR